MVQPIVSKNLKYASRFLDTAILRYRDTAIPKQDHWKWGVASAARLSSPTVASLSRRHPNSKNLFAENLPVTVAAAKEQPLLTSSQRLPLVVGYV